MYKEPQNSTVLGSVSADLLPRKQQQLVKLQKKKVSGNNIDSKKKVYKIQ